MQEHALIQIDLIWIIYKWINNSIKLEQLELNYDATPTDFYEYQKYQKVERGHL